jgi:hypothetical protein
MAYSVHRMVGLSYGLFDPDMYRMEVRLCMIPTCLWNYHLLRLFELLSIPTDSLRSVPEQGLDSTERGLEHADALVEKVLDAVSLLVLEHETDIPLLNHVQDKQKVKNAEALSQ